MFPRDIKKSWGDKTLIRDKERERYEVSSSSFLLPSLSSVRVFVGVRWWEKRGALRQESSGVFFVFFFFFFFVVVVVVVRDARARPRRDGNGQVLTEIKSRFFKFLVLSRRSNARASRFYCRCCCCCCCSFTFVSSSSVLFAPLRWIYD